VQKSASAYVSRKTLGEWIDQKKRNLEFFKKFDLMNDEGCVLRWTAWCTAALLTRQSVAVS
jgi:hypothetical protein